MKSRIVISIGALVLMGALVSAQEAPKAELSFDYSFARYAPSASYTKGHSLNGGGGRFQYNFNPYFGFAMDLQGYNSNTVKFTIPPGPKFPGGGNGTVSGNLFTYLFGPVVKIRSPKAQPYFDFLFGAAHSSVYGNAYSTICQPVAGACAGASSPNGDAFAMSVGGGIDIPINQRVQFRVGEFDYLYTRFTNQFTNAGQNNFRYLTGLNINLGMPNPKMPSVACAVEPSEVLPWAGPVKASVTPADFNPKHTLTYNWESTGGTANGQGTTATVDTTQMAPGQYTLKASITDPKQKKNNNASCTASFTVKQPQAPSVACTMSPSTVQPGQPITVTVRGVSPDMTPIDKRNFSASAGALREGETSKGSQPGEFTTVATLDTTGVGAGPLKVDVGVTDVHGLNGSCTASADVVVPPAPAPAIIPARLVSECKFTETKKNRAVRVDNQCKAALDTVALQMKDDPDGRLIIIGFAEQNEATSIQGVEARRAANVKFYLTDGDGKQQVDRSRIEIRKSTDRSVGRAAHVYFVPQNGVLQVDSTEVIDESTLPAKRIASSGN